MTGADLVAARVRLGLSTVDVAKILLVNHSTVYRWERQERVKAESLQRLALDQLYGLSVKKDPLARGDALKAAVRTGPPGAAFYSLLRQMLSEGSWSCPTT